MLPLLPITAMAAWEPVAAAFSPLVASFSMYPLLERDGLALPYAACLAVYAAVVMKLLPAGGSGAGSGGSRSRSKATPRTFAVMTKYAAMAGIAAATALHAARATVQPPAKLPWLWDRAIVSLSFIYVVAGMAYFNWRQWNQQGEGALAAVSRPQTKAKAS